MNTGPGLHSVVSQDARIQCLHSRSKYTSIWQHFNECFPVINCFNVLCRLSCRYRVIVDHVQTVVIAPHCTVVGEGYFCLKKKKYNCFGEIFSGGRFSAKFGDDTNGYVGIEWIRGYRMDT